MGRRQGIPDVPQTFNWLKAVGLIIITFTRLQRRDSMVCFVAVSRSKSIRSSFVLDLSRDFLLILLRSLYSWICAIRDWDEGPIAFP